MRPKTIQDLQPYRPAIIDRGVRAALQELEDAQATIAELRPLLAEAEAAAGRIRSALAGGDAGTGGDSPLLDGLLGDPSEALARIRAGVLDAAAARRGALAALNREERKELAELDALRGQQGVDEKKRLDTRIRIIEEYQARRGDLRERLRAEERQADERQAAEAERRRTERAAAQRAAIEEEHQTALAAAQRIEDARRTAEQGLAGITLDLSGPLDRALAAIEARGDRIRTALDEQAAAEERYTELAVGLAGLRAEAVDREAARRLAASRRWQDGVTRGLDRIREETTNYAGLAERAGTWRLPGDVPGRFRRCRTAWRRWRG